MFSSQIRSALKSDGNTCKTFLDVYPSDKLPSKLLSYPASVVVNTDPHNMPGKHWVAFYFDKNRALDYFDSYGSRPEKYPDLNYFAYKNSSIVKYNPEQLQGDYSDVCGHYCIAFISMRSNGYSMQEIIDYYSSNGRAVPGAFDEVVRNQVERRFCLSNSCAHDSCEQHCCSSATC